MNTEEFGEGSGVCRDSEGFREQARRERLCCCFVDFVAPRRQPLCVPPSVNSVPLWFVSPKHHQPRPTRGHHATRRDEPRLSA